MAQVAVIGMSSFGYYLALKLSELGSEVLAIDRDAQVIDRIKAYVTKAVVGDVTDSRILSQLGVKDMDVVVLSLGGDMQASVLAALYLRELSAKRVVAKALSEDHAKILELIGVDKVVFPEKDMGERVAVSLHGSNVADYLPLGKDLSIVELIPHKEMVGKTLQELGFRSRYQSQVLAVKDKTPEEVTFVPTPDTRIKRSHVLVVMGKNEDLEKLRKTKN